MDDDDGMRSNVLGNEFWWWQRDSTSNPQKMNTIDLVCLDQETDRCIPSRAMPATLAHTRRCTLGATMLSALLLWFVTCSAVNGFSLYLPQMSPCHRFLSADPSHSRNDVTMVSTSSLPAKKNKQSEDNDKPCFWKTIQEKPATLIFLPFVALFGIDLMLNIFFIVKRTFEYVVLEKVPSTETWF